MKKLKTAKNDIFLPGILVFIVFMGVILGRPAVFSVDEAQIILGMEGLSSSGDLVIHNEYKTLQSRELNPYKAHIRDDKLFVKYPPIYFYVALFFYKLLGVRGLLWLNIIAACLVVLIFYKIVIEMTGKMTLAYHVISVLLFATFFLEYSIAIWPHMLNLFFIMLAFYYYRKALENPEESAYLFFYTGILTGISIGVRLASVLIIFIFVIHLIWEKKHFIRRVLLFLLGLFAPLGLITYINVYRFGVQNPLSDGTNTRALYNGVPLLVPVAFIIMLIGIPFSYRLIKRRLSKSGSNSSKVFYLYILLILVITSFSIIVIVIKHNQLVEYLRNFAGYFINSAFIQERAYEGAQYNNYGIITYNGIIKKALLQSCPFLILMFGFFFFSKETDLKKSDRKLLYIILLAYPLFYSIFHFHGGMGYNFRYLIDFLPWAVLMTILAIRSITIGQQVVEVFVLAMVFFSLILTFSPKSSLLVILIIALAPTLLAAGLFIMFLAMRKYKNRILNRVFIYFLLISFGLSFAITFFQDVPATVYKRSSNNYKSELIEKYLEPNSLLFVYWGHKDALATAKINKNITLIDYSLDKGKDFFRLLEYGISTDRDIYLYGEGAHPELLEILKLEYSLSNISDELIPIYRIKRRNLVIDNVEKRNEYNFPQ